MSRNRAAVRRAKREGISYAEALRRIREGKQHLEGHEEVLGNSDGGRDGLVADNGCSAVVRRAGTTELRFDTGR